MNSKIKEIEFKNVYYEKILKNTKNPKEYDKKLDFIAGTIKSGRLTGVVGNKNCGQNDLLKILVGFIKEESKTYGEIFYNGKERNVEEWKKIVHFVPSESIYYPHFTIYEVLMFYISFNKNLSHTNKDKKIVEILKKCKIFHKKDVFMRKLTFAEYQKANIAISFINNPEVLIIEEPAVGLDSKNALEIYHILKRYAQENNSIVIVSDYQNKDCLFNYLDDLIILTKKGLFYNGSNKELENFLEEKKFEKDDKLSIPEFLSVLLSEKITLKEGEKYKDFVEKIIENNKSKDAKPTICNNIKTLSWKSNMSDIFNLSKQTVKMLLDEDGSTKQFFYVFILVFIPLLNILGHIFYSIKTFEISISEDLNSCSYYDIFLLSYLITTYIFSFYLYAGIFTSYLGEWNSDNFYQEYLNNRYNFGTYFYSLFFYNFVKNFGIFIFQLFFLCILYRNILLYPSILCFSLFFIVCFAILQTISSIFTFFSFWNFLIFLILNEFENYIDYVKDSNSVDYGIFGYLFIINPLHLYKLFMNSRCFNLSDRFENQKNILNLLGNIMKNKTMELGYNEGKKLLIIYKDFGDWSDCITLSLLFSVMCSLIMSTIIFFKVYYIPNIRIKLTK
ncbi:ATP-binding cassette sub-family G member [Vairimorpha necatrix]|uniref:ATP-binding cassette sub-family G member n=1 Tax=Vairimorpha necatrix TaxID=6039 RepID=A0AAX4J993_9MICR